MSNVNITKRITKQVSYEKNWVDHNFVKMTSQAIFSLRNRLKIGDQDNLSMMQGELGTLAVSYGYRGMVTIINNDESGWIDIYKSSNYHMLMLRICILNIFQRKGHFTYDLIDISNLLCVSIVYELRDEEEFFAKSYQRILSTPDAIHRPDLFWNKRFFEPFVYKLYSLFGTDLLKSNLVKDDLGIYTDIITYWKTPDKFVSILPGLCDYHCMNMFDNGGKWKPEFAFTPCELIPFEILAIIKLRDRHGLSTPKFSHPLTDNLPGNLYPEKYDLSDDDNLRQIRLLCDKIFAQTTIEME